MLGDRVGLLAGQAALLDREVDGVSGGVDVGQPAHATAVVDRDEPVVVARHAEDARALEGRQRDDPFGLDALLPGTHRDAAAVDLGVGVPVEGDAGFLEQRGDRPAGLLAEDRQRGALRRDEL